MDLQFNIGSEDKIIFDDETDFLEVNRNFDGTPLHWGIVIGTNSIILLVNVTLMILVRIKERNLIDMMVWMDCLANLSIIGIMFLAFPVRVFDNHPSVCFLIEFYRAVALFMNRQQDQNHAQNIQR